MNLHGLAAVIDGLRYQCRVRDLAFFDPASQRERVGRITASLERLGAGRYVIGLGPNCQEVLRVGQYAVKLGRHASPLEEPHAEVIDCAVNDSSLHGPREVSRCHCTLDPIGCADDELQLIDEGSSTGTWLLPASERIVSGQVATLSSGTCFSLGPSGVNMFLFVCVN